MSNIKELSGVSEYYVSTPYSVAIKITIIWKLKKVIVSDDKQRILFNNQEEK